MNSKDITNITILIRRIYDTQENELVCDHIQELLPVYVEAEFEGNHLDAGLISTVELHLHQCPDCLETYQGLYFLLELEANEQIDVEETAVLPAQQTTPSKLTPVAGS